LYRAYSDRHRCDDADGAGAATSQQQTDREQGSAEQPEQSGPAKQLVRGERDGTCARSDYLMRAADAEVVSGVGRARLEAERAAPRVHRGTDRAALVLDRKSTRLNSSHVK